MSSPPQSTSSWGDGCAGAQRASAGPESGQKEWPLLTWALAQLREWHGPCCGMQCGPTGCRNGCSGGCYAHSRQAGSSGALGAAQVTGEQLSLRRSGIRSEEQVLGRAQARTQ